MTCFSTVSKVLAVGGNSTESTSISSSEIFDPANKTWTSTGSMSTIHSSHTATLMPDGRVLVVGGIDGKTWSTSVEIFNPETNSWSSTGSLNIARGYHTATLLLNGTILVVGGVGNSSPSMLASAEIYNPSTGSWSNIASLSNSRFWHTATLLTNGKVLVAGGLGLGGSTLSSTEIYDPEIGSWAGTASMGTPRYFHTATSLPDGSILVAGGQSSGSPINSVERYIPASGSWVATGSLNTNRGSHSALLLPNGNVMVTGGSSGSLLNSVELYNPSTGAWSILNAMNTARMYHSATLLMDGRALVVGGHIGDTSVSSSAELYDPAVEYWTSKSSMDTDRTNHTSTLLPNGKVIVVGGSNSHGIENSTELYDPIINTWVATGQLNTARHNHTATLLPNGKLLISGGNNGSTYFNNNELFEYADGTWSNTTSMTTPRAYHSSTLLPNGCVLVVGGYGNGTFLPTAEIFNPTTESWTNAASMSTSRIWHSAILLPNGLVLIVGGYNGTWLNSAELYNPSTDSWTSTGSLNYAREDSTITLLENGQALVTGGFNGSSYLSSTELYNPATGSWVTAGAMSESRSGHTSTLLRNGKVLVTGGYNNGSFKNSVEQFNPVTRTWGILPFMSTARYSHTATLLPDGKILVMGGENSMGYLQNTEVFTRDLGYITAWQPTIYTTNSPALLGQATTVTGSGFRGYGNTEANSGGRQSSPTNYPLIQLRHLDSEQTIWLPTTSFSTTDFLTKPISGINPGPALMTVYVNGIPSLSQGLFVINPPIISLSSSTYSQGEDGLIVTITVNLNPASPLPATVDFFTSDGTATAGEDYTATSGTLTFSPTDISKTFDVPITDDAIYEGDETFTVTLSNPNVSSLGTPATATITIVEDDDLPVIALSSATYSVNEAGPNITITTEISGARQYDATIQYSTSPGTATASIDYTTKNGMLTFLPSDDYKEIIIPITDDLVYEKNETFSLTLSNPTGAVLGDPAAAIVTIIDNDTAPVIILSSATYSVDEADGTVTVTANISGLRQVDATVQYLTFDSSATAGSDYIATSGELTISPSEASKSFMVSIINDSLYEGDETFTVILFNPSDATLGTPSSAVVTITDDDTTADLSITKVDTPDPVLAGQTLTYTITVSNAGPRDASDLVVSDTLPPGVTFISASGTGWTCGEDGGTVTCQLAALANGADSAIEILVSAPMQAGEITNTVSVSSAVTDPDTDNNTVSITTTVMLYRIFLPLILN